MLLRDSNSRSIGLYGFRANCFRCPYAFETVCCVTTVDAFFSHSLATFPIFRLVVVELVSISLHCSRSMWTGIFLLDLTSICVVLMCFYWVLKLSSVRFDVAIWYSFAHLMVRWSDEVIVLLSFCDIFGELWPLHCNRFRVWCLEANVKLSRNSENNRYCLVMLRSWLIHPQFLCK
jgi:hypothetical protein